MATQAERRAATRSTLIRLAREHFVQSGYEQTHTNDILNEAGLSRGAMYHHFGSKQELFEEVFIEVSQEAVAYAIKQGEGGHSALESLTRACLAWLKAVRRPDAASILIDQGPRVLGWARAQELEAKISFRPMRKSLEQAAAEGAIQVNSIDLAARFINALLTEAAMVSNDQTARISKTKIEAMLRQFITGLTHSNG